MKMINIEAERSRLGMTKTELSKRLGITLETYKRYINGNPIPSDKLLSMKSMFNCSIDYLLMGMEPKKEEQNKLLMKG